MKNNSGGSVCAIDDGFVYLGTKYPEITVCIWNRAEKSKLDFIQQIKDDQEVFSQCCSNGQHFALIWCSTDSNDHEISLFERKRKVIHNETERKLVNDFFSKEMLLNQSEPLSLKKLEILPLLNRDSDDDEDYADPSRDPSDDDGTLIHLNDEERLIEAIQKLVEQYRKKYANSSDNDETPSNDDETSSNRRSSNMSSDGDGFDDEERLLECDNDEINSGEMFSNDFESNSDETSSNMSSDDDETSSICSYSSDGTSVDSS